MSSASNTYSVQCTHIEVYLAVLRPVFLLCDGAAPLICYLVYKFTNGSHQDRPSATMYQFYVALIVKCVE